MGTTKKPEDNRYKRPKTAAYKPSQADREMVKRLLVAGWQKKEIYKVLNIAFNTFQKHFKAEVATSKAILTGKAIKTLEYHLDSDNLDAAKFYLERKAGWKSKSEVTTKDGGFEEQEIEEALQIINDDKE